MSEWIGWINLISIYLLTILFSYLMIRRIYNYYHDESFYNKTTIYLMFIPFINWIVLVLVFILFSVCVFDEIMDNQKKRDKNGRDFVDRFFRNKKR